MSRVQRKGVMKTQAAILSVSDKTGIVEFAQSLQALQVQILSTGSTAEVLEKAGVAVTPVSKYTGFPEILDGRVKTLHPRIHAGILARQDHPEHLKVLAEHQILSISLVAVNLYPFSRTVAREDVTVEEAIEQIDIGGPTLIRASAKNFRCVTVLVDPADYPAVVEEMKAGAGQTSEATRWKLARKAFRHTAVYDLAISRYLDQIGTDKDELPASISLVLLQHHELRYGENPHQQAALYRPTAPPTGLAAARQYQGKELSFNNYLDLDAAWRLACEFDEPFCAIIKHTNPCGAAAGAGLSEAYQKALACDPVSAFGSVIGFNRRVDARTAEQMAELFVEAVIAPGYEPEAVHLFAKKKTLRLMEIGGAGNETADFDFKRILGGFLVQELDRFRVRREALKTVTARTPSEEELNDLLFAWVVCKHVKSNAIVYAREGQTLGIGAGQMSRVDSVRLGAQKARSCLEGCVLASDAFFPFRDGIDEAARAGVKAVIQPGGSVRDQEVIRAADEHGMAMVFTGVRHFRH